MSLKQQMPEPWVSCQSCGDGRSHLVGECMCLLRVTWSCVLPHREAVAGIQVGTRGGLPHV